MLELKHISYRVSTPDGEQDILKDISITIPDEKLVVFTGPNGGGKTTMAKVIMGLAEPTSGQILYNGQDITHLSITERARLGISYGFATILARQGSLMIFDEPEAGIDLWSFARLTETFEQIHQQHRATMIIISHQERIIRLADEILLISGGQVTGRGTADDIYPQILADTVTGCNMLEVDGTC